MTREYLKAVGTRPVEKDVDFFGDDRNENRGTILEKRGGNRIDLALFVEERI